MSWNQQYPQQPYNPNAPPYGYNSPIPPNNTANYGSPQFNVNQPPAFTGYPQQFPQYNQPPSPQQPMYNQPPRPIPSQPYYPQSPLQSTYNQPPPLQPQYNLPPPPQQPIYNQPPPPQQPTYNQPPQQPRYNQPMVNQAAPYQPYTLTTLAPSGRKLALIIGINYFHDPKLRLKGCVNDAFRMKQLLMQRYGFQDTPTTMVVLTDDQQDPWKKPTKQNILTAMKWLVSQARPGDSLFFHFSGHGSQVLDTNGDEEDGLDETICPADFRTAGQITDDEIHDILVKAIPHGARLTALMDCCHSGTGMDLPYVFTARGLVNEGTASMSFMSGQHSKESFGDVLLFSGCRDDQTSADTSTVFSSGGAMTNAFIEAISRNPNVTYAQLLYDMRGILNYGPKAYTQIPQLSCGRPMDLNQRFSL